MILWFSRFEMYGILRYDHAVLVGRESFSWLWGRFVWCMRSLDILSDAGCHRISFAALLLLSVRSNVNYPRYVSTHANESDH